MGQKAKWSCFLFDKLQPVQFFSGHARFLSENVFQSSISFISDGFEKFLWSVYSDVSMND